MSEIERMQRYIERTKLPAPIPTRYDMSLRDMFVLLREDDTENALLLAFKYGQAKGYRAAKAERRAAV